MKVAFIATLFAGIVSAVAVPEIFARDTCPTCVSSPNNCDITAPCSNFLGTLYCGCRPGYKAGDSKLDHTSQWRIDTIPGHEHRVWVTPGTPCDTLCNEPFGPTPCFEVPVNTGCPPQ